MIERCAAFFLFLVCPLLTGCLSYPITVPAADASAVSSPYSVNDITLSGDVLRVQLDDPAIKNADFREIKIVKAVLTTDTGKQTDLTLESTEYGNGVTFRLKLNAVNGHFGLRVITILNGQTRTITGKLWIHEVGKTISWQELDHG